MNIFMALKPSPPTIIPGWTPLSLSGTRFWFDPRQLATPQGSFQTSLPNLQTTAPLLAQVTASGAGRMVQQIRGRKALKYLRTSIQQFGAANTGAPMTFPFYIFGVFCSNDPNSIGTLLGGAPGSGDNFRVQNIGTSNVYPRGLQLRANLTLTKAGFIPAGRPVAFRMKCNGTTSEITVTGQGTTSGSMGPTLTMTGLNFGIDGSGSNTFGGCIGECFGVQGPLTPQEESDGLTYLDVGWQTTAPAKSGLFKGDSNTNGFGTTVPIAAFRGYLDTWGQGQPGGYYLDMMGPVQFADLANSNAAGYNGATILDTIAGGGTVPNSPAQLAALGYLPDFKSLLIGTNDCNNNPAGYGPTALANLDTLLRAEDAAQPNCPGIICELPPSATASTQSNINAFNAGLPAVVASVNSAGGRWTIAPLAAALGTNPGPYMQDNLHMNPAGMAVVASVLEPIIQAIW